MNLKHTIIEANGEEFLVIITKPQDSHVVLTHAAVKQSREPGTFTIRITRTVLAADEEVPEVLETNW